MSFYFILKLSAFLLASRFQLVYGGWWSPCLVSLPQIDKLRSSALLCSALLGAGAVMVFDLIRSILSEPELVIAASKLVLTVL